jgi:hypothetical protein
MNAKGSLPPVTLTNSIPDLRRNPAAVDDSDTNNPDGEVAG